MQDRSSYILMRHYRNPVANRVLDHPTFEATRRNNLCGDEIHLQLMIDKDGYIIELGWQAKGCMLVKSSASILSAVLNNRLLDEARELAGLVMNCLDNMNKLEQTKQLSELPGDILALEQMSSYPARVPCIKLAWQAFLDAIPTTG